MNDLQVEGIFPHSIVADILKRYPQTVTVFLKLRMLCVGCVLARFDTLEEAAQNHSISQDELIRDLRSTINPG